MDIQVKNLDHLSIGDVPLFVRIADGNEADKAVLARVFEAISSAMESGSYYIADSTLYSANNLQQLGQLRWITRVPASLKMVNILVESMAEEALSPTLRLVFQCFQAVHIVIFNCQKQVSNLTDTRLWILNFLGAACQKYYLLY